MARAWAEGLPSVRAHGHLGPIQGAHSDNEVHIAVAMADESLRGFAKLGIFASQDAVAGPMVQTSGASFTWCPHRGVVSLESISGAVVLVHHETQEVVPAPVSMQGCAVSLDCDEAGFAYVYTDSSDDIVWVDDLFKLQLARDSAGRKTVLRATPQGPPDFAVLHDEYRWCADEGVLKLDVPCGPQQLGLSATIFRVPRAGSRVFFDVYQVLKGLSFTAMSTEKTASRFVYKRFSRWFSFLSNDLGVDGQLIKSAQYASHRKQNGEGASRQGAAPQMSFLALVALLLRWSGAPRAFGGALSPMDRECALRMLKAFSTLGLGDAWRLEAFVDLSSWRDGFAKGRGKVAWQVAGDGAIALILGTWRMDYAKKVDDPTSCIDLLGLLMLFVSSARNGDMFKQVVHQVSMVWQTRLLQQVEGLRNSRCVANLRIGDQVGTSVVSKQDIQRCLLVYWASGRDWARGRQHMSVAVDKSRVGGRCFWMLPQEFRGGLGLSRLVGPLTRGNSVCKGPDPVFIPFGLGARVLHSVNGSASLTEDAAFVQ